MPNEDKMTIDERFKYLRMQKKRYAQMGRKERAQILDETEQITGLNRKTLIRHMNGNPIRKPRRRQRGKTYGPEVDDALRVIFESLDYICAERLTPHLVPMALQLAAHGELQVTPPLLEQLGRLSVSTVRRRLKKVGRLDSVAQTLALNNLYDKMWLYYNFFQPVMRLVEKTVISESGTWQVKRRFDKPQTPFERLCATGALSPARQVEHVHTCTERRRQPGDIII